MINKLKKKICFDIGYAKYAYIPFHLCFCNIKSILIYLYLNLVYSLFVFV